MWKNLFLSFVMFLCLLVLLWLAQTLFSVPNLLKWRDAAWCVGLPASIIGVAYVLTIRNPLNYTGFYPGILMSLLLSVQFFLQTNYDLTLLYLCVFIPFQARSIIQWKRHQPCTDEAKPQFLSTRMMLLTVFVFMLLFCADWLLVSFMNCGNVNQDCLIDGWLLKLLGGLMIASSVMANFWLIYRKNDAWIYWIIYSLAGIGFYVVVGNIFSIVLFVFFLIVNSVAAKSWIFPSV